MSYHERLALANKENEHISLSRQAELLDISRSSVYYTSVISKETIKIMNAIDEVYTEFPYFGHRKIRKLLANEHSIHIGRKRTLSLMNKMGLQAIYPKKKPNTSQANNFHKKFPYLLRNLPIIRPNQVWGTDITYIRLISGFIYLTAIMDWFSRYVISWKLSPTLENDFCIKALEKALKVNMPEIHNSDQGVQYTSRDYIAVLESAKAKISMDGRGRCFDNIFTERLWRSVKQENIYIHDYNSIDEAQFGLTKYFNDYNNRRPHQSLDESVPAEIYFNKK
ncbi:IS3 family transposase [Candidatus Parcubacteria bacterium]|nr:IS3 family transposase [Candidatus Parcubacteria bacterium]